MLIILDWSEGNPHSKNTSGVEEEERAELSFARLTARNLLKWLKMSVQEAKTFVEESPYYSPGTERVEIPALADGTPDTIFPDMKGVF